MTVVTKTSFTRVGTDEPHKSRRSEILAKHPEIKALYGPDIRLFPCILALVSVQLTIAVLAVNLPLWQWLITSYIIGGTLTHWLSLGNHELAHNLCFKKTLYNELLGSVSNFAQGLPSAVTFKKYHLEHHYSQGVDVIDMDVPTEWEGRVFNNTWKKVFWVLLQPVFYAVRPVLMNPKPYTVAEAINLVSVLSFDAAFAYCFGIKALLFNVVSLLLGMGLHPVAGHFIAEHYTLGGAGKDGQPDQQQETFSYYGVLNYVTFNVGYHNEHHDFPRVPGLKLPMVKKLAPEYYSNLHSYESWTAVIYDYIIRSDIGPFSRVIRSVPNRKLA
jgi:sphingolipid delta-4 desaturase